MKKCTVKCKFFRCARRALVIKRMSRTAIYFCNWVGDLCQGPECQYAMCAKHAMNPDGTCREAMMASAKAKAEKKRPSEEEFEKRVKMSEKAQRAFREIKKFMEEAGMY